MYLWNTNALARELKDGTLSEREKFKYLLVNLVLYALIVEMMNYVPIEYSESVVLMSIFNILSVVIGTYICYRTNGGSNGAKFMERYICLGLPIAIKITVSLFAIIIFLPSVLWILIDSFVDSKVLGNTLGNTYSIVFTIIYYWRLNVHIKSISHNDATAVPA